MESIIIIAAAVLLGILLLKLLTAPIKGLIKFLIHAAFGYVLLFVVNFFGSSFGIVLDMNLVTAAVAGFGGIPGVVILVILKLLA